MPAKTKNIINKTKPMIKMAKKYKKANTKQVLTGEGVKELY